MRLELFQFKHRKLKRKAREFQHEVTHLTLDLVEINRRIHETGSLCKFRIDYFGAKDEKQHLFHPRHRQYFDDFLYHLENFTFRTQAYRDKLSLFVSYALGLGFDENDQRIFGHLLKNTIVKEVYIDTELKKFTRSPPKDILERRKLMSHKQYYHSESYNPHFVPKEISPRVVGYKKAARLWAKNIQMECSKSDRTVRWALGINEKVAKKTVQFLKKQR